MSPIAIVLDLLLAALLTLALVVGMRLNGRLKTLRDGHAGFAQAVVELNEAAGRAEAGLATLRAASEEAHDSLLTRIETARSLIAKLERANQEAERAHALVLSRDLAEAPEPGVAPTAYDTKTSAGRDRVDLTELMARFSSQARATPGAPTAEMAPAPRGGEVPPPPAFATPPQRPATAAPRRSSFDEDLFEGAGPDPAAVAAPVSPTSQTPTSSASGSGGRSRGDRR